MEEKIKEIEIGERYFYVELLDKFGQLWEVRIDKESHKTFCTCKGFTIWQKCWHCSTALEELKKRGLI